MLSRIVTALNQETAEWLQLGQGIRGKLLARKNEINALRAELQKEEIEIDAQLKLIPEIPTRSVSKPGSVTLGGAFMAFAESVAEGIAAADSITMPGLIKSLLMAAPNRELSSKVIVEQVVKQRGVNATRVHSELFRMKERKQIASKGDRPHTIFYLPKEAAMSP
jgi:hypothetical protein